jgi:hypothetical protein
MLKFLMIVIMLVGITFSIINFISIESQAGGLDNGLPGGGGNDGTTVELPDGTTACQGAPLDCHK